LAWATQATVSGVSAPWTAAPTVPRCWQLSGLSENGQPAEQRFPVLQTAAGALFGSDTQNRLER